MKDIKIQEEIIMVWNLGFYNSMNSWVIKVKQDI
jgi:hypothetical protein